MKQKRPRSEPLSVMAQDAARIASGWLRERLPDRFSPSDPTLDQRRDLWRVPVVLAYPGITLGEVGEIFVRADSGEIVSHTDIEQLKTRGLELGRKHRAKVRAAFLRTRNA